MSKQAQVGLFTILGFLAVAGVFYVISDWGTRSQGYKIGVHFRNAGGLQNAALVYLSGIPIGAVDRIKLLPDYTTDVILAIKPGYNIPKESRFLIQAPITGEPTVLIEPPSNVAPNPPTLAHELLPVDEQPSGSNPTSVEDLLAEGQGEVRRLDDILAQFESAEPVLLGQLKSTLSNANALTVSANHSLSRVTANVDELTASLQTNLTVAGGNVRDLTSRLDATVQNDSGQVDQLLAQLNRTSRSFGETVDSLRDVATNPAVKQNLIDTTRDFAATAKAFAALTGDLHNMTSNPQTQEQLRDTVAQLDATSQRVDSLVGQFGGTSHVYGVDANATPAPAPTPLPPGYLPTSAPAVPPSPAPGGSAVPYVPGTAAPDTGNRVASSGGMNVLRQRLNQFTKDLVLLQVRASELAPLRPGSTNRNVSPLLTADRGLQSDFNVFFLPRAGTSLEAGVNDVGSPYGTTTGNLMLLSHKNGLTYGGGIEYSRLGIDTSIASRVLGIEARAYDLRHPTLDSYLNFFLAPKLQLFGGERDLTHASRRTTFGLQFEF